MMKQQPKQRAFSTSNPNRPTLTKYNHDMQTPEFSNTTIATPIIVLQMLNIMHTRCAKMLNLNIGLTYSLFKRRTKFITQKEDKSAEIQTQLNNFVKTYASNGTVNRLGSARRKEEDLIKRWNAALEKLYLQNEIDTNTIMQWKIPINQSVSWFGNQEIDGAFETLNSLDVNTNQQSSGNQKEYFKSMEKTVKYLEQEAKNQEEKKGDDAKTDLTNLVLKTAATINTAQTFFKNTSNITTIEDMYKELEKLVANAKLGHLAQLLNDINHQGSVAVGNRAFENILPENIKKNYGNDKTFESKENKCYVEIWQQVLGNTKQAFTESFNKYKQTIKTIRDKIDQKTKDQIELADSTQNDLIKIQKNINLSKTIIEKNKSQVYNISPILYDKLTDFCKKCVDLLAGYGELNKRNRANLRQCYLPKKVIRSRDSARNKFYELTDNFSTVRNELKSGRAPSCSPLNLETLNKDLETLVNKFSNNVNSSTIQLNRTPSFDTNVSHQLTIELEEMQKRRDDLIKLINETVDSTTLKATLLNAVQKIVLPSLLTFLLKHIGIGV